MVLMHILRDSGQHKGISILHFFLALCYLATGVYGDFRIGYIRIVQISRILL